MVRVTQNILTQSVLASLRRNLESLAQVQAQISTGRRFQRVSDNPIDFTQSLALRQSILAERRYVRNEDISETSLNLAESGLQEVTNALQRARELAVSAANEALPPESRNAIADEIEQLFQRILQVANSAFDRGYLFAGDQTLTQPFVVSGGFVIYRGDEGRREIEVARGVTVPVTVHGLETFIAQPNRMLSLAVADPDAALATQLSASSPPPVAGQFTINGKTVTFDPATQSLKELRDAINAAEADVTARIENNRLVLVSQRSVDIAVESGTPANPGNVLSALGLFRRVESDAFAAPISPATDLTAPPFGLSLQGLRVTLDGETIDVDLSAATTVQDVLDAVRTATGGRVDGFVNDAGTGLVFSATYSAESFEIGDLRRAFGTDLGAGPLDLSTQLSALAGFPFGTLTIGNGADSATIDLSTLGPTATIGDLVERIEAANLNVEVVLNAAGNGLDLVSRDPTLALTVSAGATAAALGWSGTYDQNNAGDLGIDKAGTSDETETRSVFETLRALEEAIRTGGDIAAINAGIAALDVDLTTLLDVRSEIGARINRLEASRTRSEAMDIFMVSLLSQREDVDLAQALTDLASRERVFEASLSAASRVLQPSLIAFLT